MKLPPRPPVPGRGTIEEKEGRAVRIYRGTHRKGGRAARLAPTGPPAAAGVAKIYSFRRHVEVLFWKVGGKFRGTGILPDQAKRAEGPIKSNIVPTSEINVASRRSWLFPRVWGQN